MRRAWPIALLWLVGLVTAAPLLRAEPAQEVVDRIVARIDEDILTSSELRELAAYQKLMEEKPQPPDKLLSELIEQWVVNGEATAAHFPLPADSDVENEVARIRRRFANQQAYEERLAEVGVSPESVRRIMARQIFLARYLDYKFRPAIQVDDAAVEKYYQQEFTPALALRGQKAPPIDDVREQIRELLVQRGISERASTWMEETKSRLNIEIQPAASISPGSAAP